MASNEKSLTAQDKQNSSSSSATLSVTEGEGSPRPWKVHRTGDKLSLVDANGKFILRKVVSSIPGGIPAYNRLLADFNLIAALSVTEGKERKCNCRWHWNFGHEKYCASLSVTEAHPKEEEEEACPECGCEQRHSGTGHLLCECPVPLEAHPEDKEGEQEKGLGEKDAASPNTREGQMERDELFTDRFSDAEKELAAKIENDIVEGIDGGETREQLRMAVNYWACAELDQRTARSVANSDETLKAIEHLRETLEKSENAPSVLERPEKQGAPPGSSKSGSSLSNTEGKQ